MQVCVLRRREQRLLGLLSDEVSVAHCRLRAVINIFLLQAPSWQNP